MSARGAQPPFETPKLLSQLVLRGTAPGFNASAGALGKFISNCETPMTIGIQSGWEIGKSVFATRSSFTRAASTSTR